MTTVATKFKRRAIKKPAERKPQVSYEPPFKRVYLDNTPMSGYVVGADYEKKPPTYREARPTMYYIQMRGKWPGLIRRTPGAVSEYPNYESLYPGKWNLNPMVVLRNGTLRPGIYHAVNYHDCPNKGIVRIIVRPDGKVATQCLGCGIQPLVVYDRGQFSYMRANPEVPEYIKARAEKYSQVFPGLSKDFFEQYYSEYGALPPIRGDNRQFLWNHFLQAERMLSGNGPHHGRQRWG